MRRIIQNSTWWLPVTAGLLVVLFLTTVVLRMGPRPAVAPEMANQPPALPPQVSQVVVEGVKREYRGWLEVPAGDVSVRVTAPGADRVLVARWLTSEDVPVVDADVLQTLPQAQRQADGTWLATWPARAGEMWHAIFYAQAAGDGFAQSETLNIKAVRP